MFKSIKDRCVGMSLHSLLRAFMALAISIGMAACDSDEPENGSDDPNTPASGIVTEAELVGKWTLVKDNVLYSEINPQKKDDVITYKGGSAPYYHFYKVTASDDGIISIAEVSASGSVIGSSLQYTLRGNDLVTADEQKVAGTIESYDPKHSWDNLRIKWNQDLSPLKFGAPVISTYMLGY